MMQELSTRTTAAGWTLADLTRPRRTSPSAPLYAGDAASYEVFAAVLDPFIASHHGAAAQPPAARWTQARPRIAEHLGDDPALLSTWVVVHRNLRGLPFCPLIDRRTRLEVEARVVVALHELRGRFPGRYHSLALMSPAQQRALDDEGLGFAQADRCAAAAGITRDWPSGRGLWRGDDDRRIVRINGEDHVELIARDHGGNLAACFCAARELATVLEGALGFHYDDRLGYLTSSAANVGTGLRISAVTRLPRLAAHADRLAAYTRQLGLDHRRAGELVELCNHSRLGCSNTACVERFAARLAELLELERSC